MKTQKSKKPCAAPRALTPDEQRQARIKEMARLIVVAAIRKKFGVALRPESMVLCHEEAQA